MTSIDVHCQECDGHYRIGDLNSAAAPQADGRVQFYSRCPLCEHEKIAFISTPEKIRKNRMAVKKKRPIQKQEK